MRLFSILFLIVIFSSCSNDKKVRVLPIIGNYDIEYSMKNGVEVDTETPIFTGDKIETGIQEEKNPIVSDIFKYFSAEELLGNPNGMLQIEINSEKGEFTTKLKANDRVRLYYKN